MTFHDHRRPHVAAVLPAARKQLGPVTLAIRAMRAAYGINAKAPTRRPGPVTEAIRAMRAAVPDFDANPDLIALRRALANRIEADIAALDMLGGDPDLEDGADAEPSLCGTGTHEGGAFRGVSPSQGGDDREEENEHGGDIQDEPHDPEEDCGAEEDEGSIGGVLFDGVNYAPSRFNRRVGIIPSGVVIKGPDGTDYSVSRVSR